MLNKLRALWVAGQNLGWIAALKLSIISLMGRSDALYTLRIAGYPYSFDIRGGKSSDAIVVYQLLAHKEYAFLDALESPRLIVDGGANIGMASVYFLNRYPTSKVLAVEPHPRTFRLCCKNLEPYGERVTVLEGAIWKEQAQLRLREHEEGEWATTVEKSDDEPASVQGFTLSALVQRCGGKIDLLKLDIEGAELEVFSRSIDEWLPAVRNIVIELHSPECRDSFFNALAGYKYDLLQHPKKPWVIGCCNIRVAANSDTTSDSA